MDERLVDPAFAPAAPGSVVLADNELHVWAVPLTGDADRLGALLSDKERQKLERLRFADHRRRFEIGHGALRTILGGYLGEHAAAIEFVNGPRGKPYVSGKGPFFNTSHSGKLGIVAIAKVELGVDLEKVRHLESLTEIARRHFSPCEWDHLSLLDGEHRELAFYRCWTRKEAYIKALGEGLSMPLDIFDVAIDGDPRLLACRDGRERPEWWRLLDVSPGPSFAAAVALRVGEVPFEPVVRRFELVLE